MGLVTALAAGDVLNQGATRLVAISADGACRVLRATRRAVRGGGAQPLAVCLAQPLQSNIRCALVTDVDGDGCLELLVALTDRVVRTYRSVTNGRNNAHVSPIFYHQVHGRPQKWTKWPPAGVEQVGVSGADTGPVHTVWTRWRARRLISITPALCGGTTWSIRC